MADSEIRAKILEVQTAAEKLMELYRTCIDTAQEVDAAELATHAQKGHALAAQMSEACNAVMRALDS